MKKVNYFQCSRETTINKVMVNISNENGSLDSHYTLEGTESELKKELESIVKFSKLNYGNPNSFLIEIVGYKTVFIKCIN